MADEAHLDVLDQGKNVWNAWRLEHFDTVPDLSSADLSGRNLSEFHLVGADMRECVLDQTNLERTWLSSADLQHASIERARLLGTWLDHANLEFASMRKAFMRNVDLREANLIGANLKEATMDRCKIEGTILDEKLWVPVILEFWDDAGPANKVRLINALLHGTILRREWGTSHHGCPITLLRVVRPKDENVFVWAWDTHAITRHRLLTVLREKRPDFFKEVEYVRGSGARFRKRTDDDTPSK